MALPALQSSNPFSEYDDVPEGRDREAAQAFKNRDRSRIQKLHAGELNLPQSGAGVSAEDEDAEPGAAEQFAGTATGVSPEDTQDEVQGKDAESRISQLYARLREKSRAQQAAKAMRSKAKKAAVRWALRAILLNPYVLGALAVIGVLLAITGFALYLTTLVPGSGAVVGEALSQ